MAIPPRSEVVSYWHVTGFPESYQNEEILGFLEPAEKIVKSGSALVARLVGFLKNGEIPVRMMNQKVYPGTLIANLRNVEPVFDSY